MEANKKIIEALLSLRERNPLVHHITNYVTANDSANITLAIGASPVMADDIDEVSDITAMASSLVINLGTLNKHRLEAMLAAAMKAKELQIPIVLDPVGAGATIFRLEAAKRILSEAKPTVVKGNLTEMKALFGMDVKAKGVDAVETLDSNGYETIEMESFAKVLTQRLDTTVVITGKIDIIAYRNTLYKVDNGTYLMSKVTGTGCMCGSLIASYLGAGADALTAALGGVVSMGIAGEIAAERLDSKLGGSGSFKAYMIDAVYKLEEKEILKRSKVYEI